MALEHDFQRCFSLTCSNSVFGLHASAPNSKPHMPDPARQVAVKVVRQGLEAGALGAAVGTQGVLNPGRAEGNYVARYHGVCVKVGGVEADCRT
jgi:hypothetical protein